MRVKVQIGTIDDREVTWYQPIEDFPKLIKFLGRNYEFVFYDDDPTGRVDKIFIFTELPSYDPNYNVIAPTWESIFGPTLGSISCECGASHSSFSWDHMRFCRYWKPWSKI